MTGASDRSKEKESHWLRLIGLKDDYEIYTAKSLGHERSKSLALSVVSNFRRSLRVALP